MEIELLAVDGLNLIRRIFEARQVQAATDMPAAIEATTQSLRRAVSRHRPSHVVVVLEENETTWRHLLSPEYKAGRSETPSLLTDALPSYRAAFLQSGVASVQAEGYEADDVIATLTHVVHGHGGRVVILSTDKVFLQLVSGGVTVFDHFNEVSWDTGAVAEKYGVAVEQFVDYLALVGDSSNNIKGVQGIGPKTAMKLLREYRDLEAMLAADAASGPVSRVQAATAAATMSRQLVTLKNDIELGINLRSLRLHPHSHDQR